MPELEHALEHPVDFKSTLQERLAQRGEVVDYAVTAELGPAARPHLRGRSPRSAGARSAPARGARRSTPSRRPLARPSRCWTLHMRTRTTEWASTSPMHLRSVTLKGFKSFPDRTQLEFAPGRVGRRRPQRLGQVQRHRRGPVGDGRAVAARRPRPVDAGRDLRRRPRRAGALHGRGRDRARQRRRRRSTCRSARSRSCAGWTARGGRVPPQRRALPARRRARGAVGHRPGQGDALRRLAGPRRGDRHLQAARPAAAHRGGGRPRQAPQAPPPRPAQARAHPGQPRPRARRRARGAHAAAPAQAPGRGGRAARSASSARPSEARWELARDAVRARREELATAEAAAARGARRPRRGRRRRSPRSPRAASAPSRRWLSARSSARRSPAAPTPRARRPSASSCASSAPARP